jgi:hypothetical protein
MMEELNKLPARNRMPLVLHYWRPVAAKMAAELGSTPRRWACASMRQAMLGTRPQEKLRGRERYRGRGAARACHRLTTIQPLCQPRNGVRRRLRLANQRPIAASRRGSSV